MSPGKYVKTMHAPAFAKLVDPWDSAVAKRSPSIGHLAANLK